MDLLPSPAAVQLLLEGTLALSEIEGHGIRIDKEYLDRALVGTAAQIKEADAAVRADPDFATWRKLYGEKTNPGAPEQLAGVVFGPKGYKSKVKTSSGKRASASQKALEGVDLPLVKKYFAAQALRKGRDTFLVGIERETVRHADGDWFVHPSYGLNTVASFRSSCIAGGTLVEVVRDLSRFPKGIPIEDVKVGDLVYCYDDRRKLAIRKVVWAGQTGRKRVIRLHWSARGKHGHLDLTPDHRVRLASGEYVEAGKLVVGGDYRTSDRKSRAPRLSTLAMGRTDDRIYETGNSIALLDHRFVYEQVFGPLLSSEVVHHRDENHFNNTPSNLQKMSGNSEHSKHHAPSVLTDDVRRMGVKARVANHLLYGDRFPKGPDNGRWREVSKYTVLKMLALCGGSPTEVRNRGWMDFNTFKKKMSLHGVDQASVRRRYDSDGKYVSMGRLVRAAGKKTREMYAELKVGYYVLRALYAERGIDPQIKDRKKANNHVINKIEEIDVEVDVYDLEVEEFHNFIANEICVHNCNAPNVQNQPTRNPILAEMVRRVYVPRRGHQIVELDYAQVEVRVAACYNEDPRLIEYVKDPTKDMHRDMAMQVFFLSADQVAKDVRHVAKNQVTFPFFYGSYYAQIAPAVWETLDRVKVKGTDTTIRQHLAGQGIEELGDCEPGEDPEPGTFEHHIKEIQDDFWGNRFQVYAQWRKDWIAAYHRDGGCRFKTGFVMKGPHKRNDITNYAIQGSAFHCLLKAIIKLNRCLLRYKMKSRVIAQIHDCIVADVHPSEFQDFVALARGIMVEYVMREYPWLIVPLETEVESCPVDGSWFEKKACVQTNGLWVPK